MLAEHIDAFEFMSIDPNLFDWGRIEDQYYEWQDAVLESLGVMPWECQLSRTDDFTAYLGSRTGSGIGLWDSQSWDNAEQLHKLAINQGRIE